MAFRIVILPYFSQIGSPSQIPNFKLITLIAIDSNYIYIHLPLSPTVSLYLLLGTCTSESMYFIALNSTYIKKCFYSFSNILRTKDAEVVGGSAPILLEQLPDQTKHFNYSLQFQLDIIIQSNMEVIAKHKPFKNTGEDFASSNPLFAHYFYKYYISVVKPIWEETTQPAAKAQLQAQVKQSFNRMNMLAQQCQLSPNDEQNMGAILQYTELMFAKNDHLHRTENQYSKQIAEDYLTLHRLYEVVNRFGRLDEGQSKRRIYSKKKFIQIMKEIKKNPAIETAKPQEVAQSVKKSVLPAPPPVFKEQPKMEKIQQQIKKSAFKPLPKPSKLISYDKIQMQMQANRCLENAVSQLSFDRFKYARDEVIHVLELLDQLIEN